MQFDTSEPPGQYLLDSSNEVASVLGDVEELATHADEDGNSPSWSLARNYIKF